MMPSMDAFSNDLIDLQIRLRRSVGKSDLTYIRNCELAGRACTAVGFATAWLYLNPLSIVLVAIGQVARWGIAHHILHHAFEGIEGCPPRFRATSFGKGWRRLLDWNEWMLPAAFQYEHNVHHVYTGEYQDPDVVEANLEFLRTSPQPKWVKYVMTAVIALTWRLSYYAPGTFIQLRRRQQGQKPTPYELHSLLMFAHLFSPFSKEGLRFWRLCILPTLTTRFVMLPAAFLLISSHAALNVLITLIAAELLTNVYTFVLIASSHTGDDIYRFSEHSAGRGGFHRHQVLGTINYSRGPVLRDFLHMWINYQIEHHLFPNLPPSQYPKCAAEVQAICEKHGVPYRAEPLHRRMWRMLDIAVGNTSMRTDNDARSDAHAHGHAAVEPKPAFSEAFEAATPSPA
jgi:fatty acid desaturase